MSQESHIPNIIVFGQRGSGKSSLINMLARKEVTEVSETGCTKTAKSYDISTDNKMYTFWDTPGLNRGEHDDIDVPAQQTFEHLYNLVKSSGINLIIYCIRGPRLTNRLRFDYDLFYRLICRGEVPIVLVVTGLERGNDMDRWWNSNQSVIKWMGMTFRGHACVTTTKGHDETYKFKASQRKVWTLVKEHCNSDPWIPGPESLAEVPSKLDQYMKEYDARTCKEREVFKRSSTIVHNVILFGEVGCGKSSIVNMIIGEHVAKVSGDFRGCTFQNESYEANFGGTVFRIFDTPGLNDVDQGRVPHWKAIEGLYTLIRQLEGVSLLVYCIRGRVKESTLVDWNLFNKVICDGQVPIIAVVTGLEYEANLDDLWKREESQLVFKQYDLNPMAVACIVSIRGRNDEFAAIYNASQKRIRELIQNSCRRRPWSKGKEAWFARTYQESYEAGMPFFAKKKQAFTDDMKLTFNDFISQTGMSEEDSEKLKTSLLRAESKIKKKWN